MGNAANTGSGAGAANCVTAGSGVISGEGTVTRVESRFGSFVASGVCKVSGDGEAGTSVIMGGSVATDVASSTWSGTAAGMGSAANTGSGAGNGSTAGSAESVTAGVVDSGSVGSGVITGEGSVAAIVSGAGSLAASIGCGVGGVGSAGTSVITVGSVSTGVDGVVSRTCSGTSAGMVYMANTGSVVAGAGWTTGSTESVAAGVVSVVAITGGSAVVMGLPAIGSVAGV